MKQKTLSICAYEEGVDLRTINWRRETLDTVVNELDLKNGQCAVYENNARNKARIIANINGFPCLLIPPIDPKRQLSVHLEVNEFIRGMGGSKRVMAMAANKIDGILVRLQEQKRRDKLKVIMARKRNKQ